MEKRCLQQWPAAAKSGQERPGEMGAGGGVPYKTTTQSWRLGAGGWRLEGLEAEGR